MFEEGSGDANSTVAVSFVFFVSFGDFGTGVMVMTDHCYGIPSLVSAVLQILSRE